MNLHASPSLLVALLLACAGTHAADEVNNGTDPTKLATTLVVSYKYLDQRSGKSIGLFELKGGMPLGSARNMSLRVTVPYQSGAIDSGFALGDVSLKFTHVLDLNRQRGLAYSAELFFDTASRDELGTGQNVLELSGFYAKFLPDSIFAPALVQRVSLGNNKERARVNSTTLDLYYVPKLANPQYFITYDPALVRDWERDQQVLSLAITFGRMTGKALGGDSQIFIKPQVSGGADRPRDWSLQVGYKILGF